MPVDHYRHRKFALELAAHLSDGHEDVAIPGSLGSAVVAPLLAFGQGSMRDLAADSVMELVCFSLIAAWRAFSLNTAGNLMPHSPCSIRKISDDHKAFALGRQTQARIQAYELPTIRPMLADKQRCCQLQ